MKAKVIFIVLAITVLLVFSAGSLNFFTPRFSESRQILVMRSIGHQVLKSSGDSSSRVLPVRKLNDETFLIEFENNFAFVPDSLVAITHRELSKSEFPGLYTVHVMRCLDRSIIYAYEIGYGSNIACLGRNQPRDCYAIQLTFAKSFEPYDTTFLIGLATAFLSAIGFVMLRPKRKSTELKTGSQGDGIAIGRYLFYPDACLLKYGPESQELSRKETKLLKIFADNPNQLLLRDRLLKEVWEDEGVITGRSLDMFVSRLRKKLQQDSSVTLVNVHGKGYRLEL